MDRSWMYGYRTERAFQRGVTEFCNVALEHQRLSKQPWIFCPCHDCCNVKRWTEINTIEEHLYRRGFRPDYETWYWHGEKLDFGDDKNRGEGDVRSGDDNDDDFEGDRINDMMDAIEDNLTQQPRMFEDVSNAAETPLYPGCSKYSQLSAVLTLSNLKAKYGWSDTSFTSLLEALQDMFPDGNSIPKSAYYAKKLMNPLGLEYTKIDACPNDCVLYRKEYANLDACPICGVSRYKEVEGGSSYKKLPPAKVLWYLPIIPRFRRLFSVAKDAKNLVWHEKERKKDGLIRHPADCKQWEKINEEFPVFGDEARNLRLGLSTDGMNPHGTLSTQHSSWPVLLTIYNLPPWLCMKRKYIMLSLLISGPKQPGNDIDVYLAPLKDDLMVLWNEGVSMYDAHTGANFTLRAMIFCTINDFPAYGDLSGYKVKGAKACPVCDDDADDDYLSNWGKNVFRGTRKWLDRFHPYRKMKARFNGQTEYRVARSPLSGLQLFDKIKDINTKYGKGGGRERPIKKGPLWKKKSIFWDLPYWKYLSVRHCLDVMHIEKNVCDSIIGTLLNMSGTKDGLKARLDMKKEGVRPNLWPEYNEDESKAYLPRACYTLSNEEKRKFCECLHGIKVPAGYSSNIKRFVSLSDKKLSGMKSHDCHVMMQVFLPIALRGLLPKHVRDSIVKLSLFFNKICSKVIDPEELDTLQEDLKQTLCKFEMYFPPTFFDIMVHVMVHLVNEIKECGPVFLRWMYPIERYLGFLKGLVKNRAKPEASVVTRLTAQEASNFCALFLEKAKEIGVPKSRHEGRLQGHGTIGNREIKPPDERFRTAHRCILQHLSDVHPYLERHINELTRLHPKASSYVIMKEHNRQFAKWLQHEVHGALLKDSNNNISDTVECLSRGPRPFVTAFEGYDINGYCFYTKRQDAKGVHQNSGVMVLASSTEFSSARDTRPVDATQVYYGIIEEIWELDYLDFKVPVLRCKWVDNRRGKKECDHGMTLVDSSRFRDTEEPFVLASQAKQIFYVKDNIDPQWWVVVQGKRGIVGVEDVVDEDDYDKFDDTPPLSSGLQTVRVGEDVVDDAVYDREEGVYVDVLSK